MQGREAVELNSCTNAKCDGDPASGDVTGNEIVENDDAVVMRCQISISITKIEWRGSRIEKDTVKVQTEDNGQRESKVTMLSANRPSARTMPMHASDRSKSQTVPSLCLKAYYLRTLNPVPVILLIIERYQVIWGW